MTTPESAATAEDAFRREYPFRSRFLNVDGHRYHYVDEGAGKPLLFVHGNPSWSFAWRNLIKGLSTRHRCIAVDHIGCGMSEKPQSYSYRLANHVDNLARLIDELDLSDITLVAHDWGGAIGLGAAARHPERFSRFVLMNTAAFRSQAIPWRIAACRIPLLGTLAVRGLNAFAGAATFMAVERPLQPAVKAGYLSPYDSWANRIATLRFVQDIPLSPSHPSYQTLLQIENSLPTIATKPTLLIWGMKDWCFTPAFLAEFQRRLPNAEVMPVADAGHYVFEDAPERILLRMHEFFGKHPI